MTTNSPLGRSFQAITRNRSPTPLYKSLRDNNDHTTRLYSGNTNESPTARNHAQTISIKRKSFLHTLSRTLFLSASGASIPLIYPTSKAAHAATDLSTPLTNIKEARTQMDPIPSLIEAEKWDSVRAILSKPPLSDCWMKTSRPLLKDFAAALGDNPTDAVSDDAEFDALTFKEDALDHMRFLDMAVYNNIFNPIKAEGESGASKELVSSYYDDPMREYKASIAAIDGLIKLVK